MQQQHKFVPLGLRSGGVRKYPMSGKMSKCGVCAVKNQSITDR